MRLGFDLDQVVIDCLDAIKNSIYKEFGVKTTGKTYEGYYLDRLPYTDDADKNRIIGEFILSRVYDPLFYSDMLPIKEAVSSLQYLKMIGNEIYFITSRDSSIKDVTIKWFNKYEIDYDGLYFCQNKSGPVKDEGLDFFIDDHIKHLNDIMGSGYIPKKGLCLFDRPWNKDYNKMLYSKVYDWSDIVKILEDRKEVEYA